MKNWLAISVVSLSLGVAQSVSAKDVTFIFGEVFDPLLEVSIAGAKLVLTDLDTKGSTIYTNAFGNFSEKVKLGETHTVTQSYVYSYFPYRVRYTTFDIDNDLKYSVTAPNYYPATVSVDLRNQPASVRTDIGMEVISIPALAPTGSCKIDDNLFSSPGFGCVDNVRHLHWGIGSANKMTYAQAVNYCSPEEGLGLPALNEIQTISNGNGYLSHFNFDATRQYWTRTPVKAGKSGKTASLIDKGATTTSDYKTPQYVVCLIR